MPIIPAKIYRSVEWHLHHRSILVTVAENWQRRALEDVEAGCGAVSDLAKPSVSGGRSDPTPSHAARLIAADADVSSAHAWVAAIGDTLDYYAETAIADMAQGYYGRHIKIKEYADKAGVDVQAVSRMRDKLVCTCALYAAGRGLLQIDERGIA
ncbi:hypothetical protein FACS1894184_04710 [Clostridia bacterium]|nr:hypothetical protein FACS1894184_04710 [Clostridia bacterium]